MSVSMIERVAVALWDAQSTRPDTWNLLHPSKQQGMKERARAAIAAMREPTYPMIDAGGFAIFQCNGDRTPAVEAEAQVAWPAMIDAALTDDPSQ